MVFFHTKNHISGNFWRALKKKYLNILWPFGIYYCHLVFGILWPFGTLVIIWYNFPPFWYIASRKIWQTWSRFGPFFANFGTPNFADIVAIVVHAYQISDVEKVQLWKAKSAFASAHKNN
jgi:hypothetical protein